MHVAKHTCITKCHAPTRVIVRPEPINIKHIHRLIKLAYLIMKPTDVEKLIDAVKAQPILYDFRRKDNRDKQKKENAWESVSLTLGNYTGKF